jgi:hypothetical protein
MNIGDRVRLLHGKEEGIITKISSSGRIEIEIEDGFRIPAMKNEVVVVDSAEKQYFGEKPVAPQEERFPQGKLTNNKEEGIFLAYIPLNDQAVSIYVVNNTAKDHLIMISEVYGTNSQTIFGGKLNARGSQKLGEKTISSFEEWPMLLTQFFPINNRIETTLPNLERKLKFKASSFFRSKGTAPILGKNGYLFKLSESAQEIDIKKLNEELKGEGVVSKASFPRPPKEVDLHIENLTKDVSNMSNSAMLKLQLETFDKNLNYAIASGMDEITFIHGLGNGVLRNEIHKHLSQLPNIKYFQDSQKSRFGYGATLVKIQ